MTGTVVSLVLDRGFCFIKSDEPGAVDNIFCHCKALRGLQFDERLREQRVIFDIQTMPDGRRRANNVRAL